MFCGGRDVNEQLSNETRHCGLNNGRFRSAIVSIIEYDSEHGDATPPPVLDKTTFVIYISYSKGQPIIIYSTTRKLN